MKSILIVSIIATLWLKLSAIKITENSGAIKFPDTPVTKDPDATCKTAQSFSMFCKTQPACQPEGEFFQCLPNGKPTATTKCKSPKPYCVGKPGLSYCSKDPDPTCSSQNFQCLGVGTYPVIGNCQAYYKCELNAEGTTITATRLKCKKGESFNPADGGCRKGFCVAPNCPNIKSKAVWKPLNYNGYERNRMALLCTDGNPVMIYACPKNLQINLDSTEAAECVLKCPIVGKSKPAPDLNDNTKYLECEKGLVIEKKCSGEKHFDTKSLKCVAAPTTKKPEK